MRGNQKVRVKTDELLKAIQSRRAAVVKAHERDVKTYDARLAEYRAKVVTVLRDAADRVEKGRPLPDFTSFDSPFRKLSSQEPIEPLLNTAKIDRTIRTLEMAADEAISISADDYAEYLG